MNKTDKIIFRFILGTMIPALCCLILFSIGFYFLKESYLPYLFATGLVAGFIADILFLKKLLIHLFDLPLWIVAGAFILCNILIYGLFMGFPVFNLATGIIAGYYSGRRIIVRNIISPQREIFIRKILLFSVLIMVIICFSSAFLALSEETIGEELKNMLGLNFVPGKGLTITGIITGGTVLIVSQYVLTRLVLVKTIKYCESKYINIFSD
jgi:hypothetical protein